MSGLLAIVVGAASATVGEGYDRFARFFGLITDTATLAVEQCEGERCLRLVVDGAGTVPPMYVDYVFAALVIRMRTFTRPDLEVLRVDFRQPAPPATAPYAEVFRAPVRFGPPWRCSANCMPVGAAGQVG